MDEAAVEKMARTLCVAAKIDPDEMVEPDFKGAGFSSVGPASGPVPAWHRFRKPAENVFALRQSLERPKRGI